MIQTDQEKLAIINRLADSGLNSERTATDALEKIRDLTAEHGLSQNELDRLWQDLNF